MEFTARLLKANDVEEVNAEGGILIREVFVGAVIDELAAVDVVLNIMQQLRPMKMAVDDS